MALLENMCFDTLCSYLHNVHKAIHIETASSEVQAEVINELFLFLDTHRSQIFPAVLCTSAVQMLYHYIDKLMPELGCDEDDCQEVIAQYTNLIQHLKRLTLLSEEIEATFRQIIQKLSSGHFEDDRDITKMLWAVARKFPTIKDVCSIDNISSLQNSLQQLRRKINQAQILEVFEQFCKTLFTFSDSSSPPYLAALSNFRDLFEYELDSYFAGKTVLVDNQKQEAVIMPLWVSVDCARTAEHVDFWNHVVDPEMQASADTACFVACRYLIEEFGTNIPEKPIVRCQFPNPSVGYCDTSASLLIAIKIVGEILGIESDPAVAVTGTVKHFGSIQGVGWVSQKLNAVKNHEGIERVLVPASDVQQHFPNNQNDIEIYLTSAKNQPITIIPVRTFAEAVKYYYRPEQLFTYQHRKDWGEAPDVPVFFGRTQELETLEQWIVHERCRVVTIVGIRGSGKTWLSLNLCRGGIGKTDLSWIFARRIQNEFEFVIWRSLLNAPPIEEILSELIAFLSNHREMHLPVGIDEQISRVLYYLKNHRCLVILDNIETILQGGEYAGQYQPGYEEYGKLFRKIGEIPHQSCLLLTSREKPQEIAALDGDTRPVRSLLLGGLQKTEVKHLFSEVGSFFASEQEWEHLINCYSGNPLALELAARHIFKEFEGNISNFLQTGEAFFGNLKELLHWHFQRLSKREQEIVCWIAINREPVSVSTLHEDLLSQEAKAQLSNTLQSLEERLPIEKSAAGFTLQPVLIEYITQHIIERVCYEIMTGELDLLNSHALLKASSKDYVRDSQHRLILTPILSWSPINLEKELHQVLSALQEASELPTIPGYYIPKTVRNLLPALQENLALMLESQKSLETRLTQILSTLRTSSPQKPGYAAGNVLNLLCQLKQKLSKYDFSHLNIRQAYLQNVTVHDVNFENVDFLNPVFTEVFSGVFSVAFSPDKMLLAIGTTDGMIRIWRVSDLKQVLVWKAHTDWVRTVVFSMDSRILISSSDDQTIKLWNKRTGRHMSTLTAHAGRVITLAVSPHNNIFASGGEDLTVRLWDISTNHCLSIFKGHTLWVQSVAFSPDGSLLVSGGSDGILQLWDVKTGQCVKSIQEDDGFIRSVAFSPNGQVIASGGDALRLWDLNSGQSRNLFQKPAFAIRSVTFNSTGDILASGGSDAAVRIWDAQSGQPLKVFQEHTESVLSVWFSPDDRILASGSKDQSVRLWDVKTGKRLRTIQGYKNSMETLAIDPNGQILASGGGDRIIRLWDLNTAHCLKTLQGHTGIITSVAFSPDGCILASSSSDRTIRLWEINTGQCYKTLWGHEEVVTSVLFLDHFVLASSGHDVTIRLWDSQTGECLKILYGKNHEVYSLDVSSQGLLAAGCEGRVIYLWDIRMAQAIKTLQGHTAPIWSIAFSSDGNMLASGSGDNTIRLWDILTGQSIRTFTGHTNQIKSVAFHPNSQTLASGSHDQTVRLWDVSTGQCLKILHGHTSQVYSVTFRLPGHILVSGSDDETIKLWNVKTGECVKTLKAFGPWKGTNITGVTGLTNSQKATLKFLGAIENSDK